MLLSIGTVLLSTVGATLLTVPAHAEVGVTEPKASHVALNGSPADEVLEILDGRRMEDLDSREVSMLHAILVQNGDVAIVERPDGTRLAVPAEDAPDAVTLAVAPNTCEASTQGVYLRASSGYGAVGTKPTSECYHAAKYMEISTQFQAKHFIGFQNEGPAKIGKAWNTHKYTNTSTAQTTCANTKLTRWRATSQHYIIDYAGCKIYLYSATGEGDLKCGHA